MSHQINFNNISTKQCQEVSKDILFNSTEHHEIALLLAKKNYWGNAIAHLILSSEENIKGLILYLEGKGFEFRKIQHLSTVFTQHKTRHHLINDYIIILAMLKNIQSFFRRPLNFKNIRNVYGCLSDTYHVINDDHWWKDADSIKQRGFYVDYNEKLMRPQDLQQYDFQQAANHCSNAKKFIHELIKSIDDMSAEELTTLKKNLRVSNFYALMEERLAERKNSRNSQNNFRQ